MSSAVHACKLSLSTAAAGPTVTYHPRFRALLPQRLLMRDGVFNILFTYLLVPVAPLRVCTRARRKMPMDHLARASSKAGRRLLRGVPRETRHRRRRRRRRRRRTHTVAVVRPAQAQPSCGTRATRLRQLWRSWGPSFGPLQLLLCSRLSFFTRHCGETKALP